MYSANRELLTNYTKQGQHLARNDSPHLTYLYTRFVSLGIFRTIIYYNEFQAINDCRRHS